MRFVKTVTPQLSLVTTKGTHLNKYGRETHRRRPRGEMPKEPTTFVGVDGEGMTVNGDHRYVLFGVGNEQIEDSKGLHWRDVFDFAYDRFTPGNAYVGFFLGYDFTQILKTMPEDRAWMLLSKEGRAKRSHRIPGKAPHPVQHDGWQFDILTMKRLRIRPKTCECPYATCKCKHAPWMYICDVGGFFQTSFLKVIDPKDWREGTEVVSPEEYATILEGKGKRSTAVLDDDMRMYNRLENVVLGRVMQTLESGFREIGVNLSPSKWFGPGQAAQQWLKNEGVATREDLQPVVPQWFLEAARMSYFGGWFEIMMHGIVPGITHEYDINSAYPSIIAKLPCLLHGKYTYGEGTPPTTPGLCLVYAAVKSPRSDRKQHIGTMLHRTNGRIYRPLQTEGWYWWDELQAAYRVGCVRKPQPTKWVHYEPCDCPPPMAGIAALYQKRLDVGKTSSLGKSAKLTYNSAYGKYAQSVGEPIFGNPIYASRITSGCRTMILEAVETHPKGMQDVAMVATDAVYFLTEHPTLPVSKMLGEWDHAERSNITLFKPGVYWDDKTRDAITRGVSPHFKARGFKASDFAAQIERVDNDFRGWGKVSDHHLRVGTDDFALVPQRLKGNFEWPTVNFSPSFSMVTAVQALQRNSWETAGVVKTIDISLQQDSSAFHKRRSLWRDTYDGRLVYRSQPKTGDPESPSEPYTKRFGMDDPWSEESKSKAGEVPDGRVIDIMGWILNDVG